MIGFPFLSGFFTKDAIIEAAFDRERLARAGSSAASRVLGAGLTAFYMTRLMLMTFFGRARWEDGVHPHESPPVMTVPMIVLAVGSVFSGCLLVAGLPLPDWLEPVVRRAERGPRARRSRRLVDRHRCRWSSSLLGVAGGVAVRRPPRGAA